MMCSEIHRQTGSNSIIFSYNVRVLAVFYEPNSLDSGRRKGLCISATTNVLPQVTHQKFIHTLVRAKTKSWNG